MIDTAEANYTNNLCGANPQEVQSNIEKAKITILGCGGIGNHISAILATAGTGEMVLVDNDFIEISNLTRQILFSEDDVNQQKIDVLERDLLRRHRKTIFKKINRSINCKSDMQYLGRSDLLVVSADYPAQLMRWVNEYCVEILQPYINVGYLNDISVIGPMFIPNETGCYECSKIAPQYRDDEPLRQCLDKIHENFKPATSPAVNGVAAAYAAGDIIKYIGKFGSILTKNKRVGIHSTKVAIEAQDISRNKECAICGRM